MLTIKSRYLKNDIIKENNIIKYKEKVKNEFFEIYIFYNSYMEDFTFQVYYTSKGNSNCIELFTKKESEEIKLLYNYDFIEYKESLLYILNSLDYIIRELYKK